MKRSRSIKKYLESSESETESPLKKISSSNEVLNISKHDCESSSESDIGDYLLKPEKLDLDSNFFNTNQSEYGKVEKKIFSGITKLTDSESESDTEKTSKEQINSQKVQNSVAHSGPSSKMSFKQLQDYTQKIEEAKKHVELYKAKKQAEEKKTDILNLLVAGEKQSVTEQTLRPTDYHSSDFESCDSEQEDWEEIKTKVTQENRDKNIVPQGNLQITVNMPAHVKKKKGVDLLAAMKRRLNRIRKDNQVLVHKVHLLCWLAHGNYVNASINDTETLATALSLLPSEQCYPSDRVDLSYLEQIVSWYKCTIKNVEKPVPENISLDKCLQLQISKKEVYNKKMLSLIFIAILRALGIQTRLIMSLQVEPLRPPASELHSVSTKSNEKEKYNKNTAAKRPSKNGASRQSKPECPASIRDVKSITGKINKNKNKNNLSVNSNTKATCSKIVSDSKIKETVSSDRRKSPRSKNMYDRDKDVKADQAPEITPKIRATKKGSKRVEGESPELLVKSNTRSKIKRIHTDDEDFKTETKPRKSLRSSALTDINTNITKNKDSVRGNSSEQSKKEGRGKTFKNELQTKKIVESHLVIPVKKNHTRSTESKDSDASVNNRRSKRIENVNNIKILRNITKKGVRQVDGIYDSDSDTDVETVILQLDGANDNKKQSKNNTSDGKVRRKVSSRRRFKPKLSREVKESDSESEFEPTSRSPINRKRLGSTLGTAPNLKKLAMEKRVLVVNLDKSRISQQKEVDRNRLSKKQKKDRKSDSDSDYAPEQIKKKYHDSDDDFKPKTKVKRKMQTPGKSVLSENGNNLEKNKKKGHDVWVEVFLEAEKKWISVDVIYGQVHCVKEIYQRATHPVSYIVSWDNNDKLKDVTQRYCQNFNTITRKQRVDPQWWNDSLNPFVGTPTARDKEEDDDLTRQQLDQPLPKAVSEYKNHPLYSLNRHLLKYEALYPPESPTLGFIRGEAVYPRSCVYTLHTRDNWLKQAKVVKLGEQPYKIVKARPTYDKLNQKIITGGLADIFGPWQVQDYEPPTAENGIVPRNAFGNVDFFKPCMLPKGCVHLKLPGLNKIAKKMNIDIASAFVGFDRQGGGWGHPLYDGFVVCKEYEDQLICAWELEQDELKRKEEEKIDKRVYGNWKKLIKGLLIKERLKAKYDFGEPSTSNVKDKKNKTKCPSAK